MSLYNVLKKSVMLLNEKNNENFVFKKSLRMFFETLIYVLQLVLNYSLMLIVMTFNFWLFSSILLGYFLGYYIFFSDFNINFILLSKFFNLYEKIIK